MTEFLSEIDFGITAILFICGIFAFLISTISGGGGALILVPAYWHRANSTGAKSRNFYWQAFPPYYFLETY